MSEGKRDLLTWAVSLAWPALAMHACMLTHVCLNRIRLAAWAFQIYNFHIPAIIIYQQVIYGWAKAMGFPPLVINWTKIITHSCQTLEGHGVCGQDYGACSLVPRPCYQEEGKAFS